MHLNSILLFEKYAKRYFRDSAKVLEIGPDNHPSTYKKAVNNNTIIWETLDIFPSKKITYFSENEYKFPINDASFDIVLSGNVLEHVKKVWIWIKELARVCKKGGKVITIVPVSWPYHINNEIPIEDCWRIYPEGMKALYEEADLKIDICKFESLESDGYKRVIPGVGLNSNGGKKINTKLLIKKIIKWPVTSSFDTIAIGTKI